MAILGKAAFRAAVITLIAFVLAWINPFGLGPNLTARATHVLQQVVAPLYGHGVDTAGQARITVVLIDQPYYDHVFGDDRPGSVRPVWPLSNADFASGIVRRIAAAAPAALFVDVAMSDALRATSGTEHLVGTVDQQRIDSQRDLGARLLEAAGNVPTFVGDPISSMVGPAHGCQIIQVRPDQLSTARVMAPATAQTLFAAPTRTVVHAVASNWLGDDRHYPLAPVLAQVAPPRCDGRDGASGTAIASPALALFEAYTRGCAGTAVPPECRQANVRALAQAVRPSPMAVGDGYQRYSLDGDIEDQPIELQWGERVPSAMQRWAETIANGAPPACRSQFAVAHPDWEAIRNYFAQLIQPLRGLLAIAADKPCTFITTISAADLDTYPSRPGDVDVRRDLLRGHIVLLGTNLPHSQDRFDTPVNGSQPGVFLHAAALENLLTNGINYRHTTVSWPAFALLVLATFAATFFGEITMLLLGKEGWIARDRPRLEMLLKLGFLLLFGLIICGTLLITTVEFDSVALSYFVAPLITVHAAVFSGFGSVLKKKRETLADLISGKATSTQSAVVSKLSNRAVGLRDQIKSVIRRVTSG